MATGKLGSKGGFGRLGSVLGGAQVYPGWSKTASVTIDNSAGTSTPTNYVTAPFTVTYKTGMNGDFSDLRFALGSLKLPFFILSYTYGVSAVVCVRIGVLAAISQNITMYYGNANAVSASSGAGTFANFYADFTAGSLDTSVWSSNLTSGSDLLNFGAPSAGLFNPANGDQGGTADATNYYFAKNGGAGVNSTIYKYPLAGGAAVASFAGPPHGAMLDIRDDTGNLIASSGSTETAVVWEITKTGTQVQTWNFSALDYGIGCGVAYYGAGQVLLMTSDASNNFKIRIVTLNSDGSYVAGSDVWTGNLGTLQGMQWVNNSVYLLVGTGSNNFIYKFPLSAGGGAVQVKQTLSLVATAEPEGLTYNRSNGLWYYGTSAPQVRAVIVFEGNMIQARATNAINHFAAIGANTTFNGPYIVGSRARVNSSGNYANVLAMGDSAAASADPLAAANMFGIVKSHGANAYLYGRQQKASVQTEEAYTTATIDTFNNYEAKFDGANVQYFRDQSSMGASVSSNVPTGVALRPILGAGNYSGGTSGSGDYVFCYIRPYQASEPTVTVH